MKIKKPTNKQLKKDIVYLNISLYISLFIGMLLYFKGMFYDYRFLLVSIIFLIAAGLALISQKQNKIRLEIRELIEKRG